MKIRLILLLTCLSLCMLGCTATSDKTGGGNVIENPVDSNSEENTDNTDNSSSDTLTDSENNSDDEGKTDMNNNEQVAIVKATITIEGFGDIELELYPDIAPNTVSNFVELANSGYYDGLIFHRIIEGFMLQGGDPTGTGSGGPGYSIKGEFTSNGFENNLLHTDGVLSMARSASFDSAGSQFFIMTSESSHLDGEYAGFGMVISGMETVYEIESVVTDSSDKPIDDIVIESITIDTFGFDYPEPTTN